MLKAGEAAKGVDTAHLEKTQESLHENEGRELKSAQDRKAELQKHFEDTQKAKGETGTSPETGRALTPEEQVSRRQAIESGIQRSDPEIKADLEKTEKTVNEQANEKYNNLRKVLAKEKAAPYQAYDEEGHVKGEPETITQHLYDTANDELRGTETEPAIIKSLGKRVENGELELTYDDLQGYREEVGRELRKGSLPGDVFSGYKKLMAEIDNAMQEIADRHGLGKAQTDARNFYRQYAETFIDRDSPVRKALDSTERGETVKAFQGADKTGIEALAKYNPQLSRRINTLRGLQEEASALPKEKPEKFGKAPTLAPKTPSERVGFPDRPEQTTIDTQAVRERLADKWATGESSLNKWQVRALLGGGLSALIDVTETLGGRAPGLGSMVMEAGGTAAYTFGPAMVAKLLEKPGFREWITRPPEGELNTLMALPNADRITITDGLRQTIQVAQRKGIKVDPALAAMIGATAVRGPKSQKIQQTRDEWYATHAR